MKYLRIWDGEAIQNNLPPHKQDEPLVAMGVLTVFRLVGDQFQQYDGGGKWKGVPDKDDWE